MSVSRITVKSIVIGLLADDLTLPISHFKEVDDLRKEYLFDDLSLVMLGKQINRALIKGGWPKVYVTPQEIVVCDTIKSVIDLVFGKFKGSTASRKSAAQAQKQRL